MATKRAQDRKDHALTIRLAPFERALLDALLAREDVSAGAVLRHALRAYGREQLGEEAWRNLCDENGGRDLRRWLPPWREDDY